jgi:hypothetical protein
MVSQSTVKLVSTKKGSEDTQSMSATTVLIFTPKMAGTFPAGVVNLKNKEIN